jgi:acetoacetyl-CoA synthetase
LPRPQLADFLEAQGFQTYDELYAWSIWEREAFWAAFRRWAELPEAGAEFNFAEELLRRAGEGPLLHVADESGAESVWTGRELRETVAAYQQWMLSEGVAPGDRVAAYLPNWPETIALMLAATGLGAIWSSCSPDFGAPAVLDRFGQVEPKLVIATERYRFAGKTFELGERIEALRNGLTGVKRFVCVEELPRHTSAAPVFRRLAANAPLFILFSSGTTGLPKCIVHSAGGALVQIVKEHRLHSDIRPGEKLFFYTTCGWMMWNWLAVGLASGAELVLFDGSPFHPGPEVLWRMAERLRLEHFGTSAKYLALLEKQEYRPKVHHDLNQLRQIISTGSPLAPRSFDFVADAIGPAIHLASISGGTDIISGFVLGNPLRPVHRGELQGAGLGMDVQVWDPEGKRIWDQPGELVCVNRFPSMPLGFWKDTTGERYRAAYFEHYPGVWRQGDWAQQNSQTDGFVIYGRSDTTLNPGGIRIGSAEIYRQVEKVEEVLECVAVGQQWEGDERIVLFLRLRDGVAWGEELEQKIRGILRTEASPHHVPKKMIVVSDLPRTVNGKLSETAVRQAIHGRPITNLSALANPESIKEFQARPELLS